MQRLLSCSASATELMQNIAAATSKFIDTQLPIVPSATLPMMDQHVARHLNLDPYSVEDILIPSLMAFLALASLVFSLLLDFGALVTRASAAEEHRPAPPLRALMSIVTPTSSRWPTYYLSVARQGLSEREPRMRLSLDRLIGDTLHGNIELRSPESDLPDLLAGTLQTGGWKISLTIGFSWRLSLMARITGARMACMLPQVSSCAYTSGNR